METHYFCHTQKQHVPIKPMKVYRFAWSEQTDDIINDISERQRIKVVDAVVGK